MGYNISIQRMLETKEKKIESYKDGMLEKQYINSLNQTNKLRGLSRMVFNFSLGWILNLHMPSQVGMT